MRLRRLGVVHPEDCRLRRRLRATAMADSVVANCIALMRATAYRLQSLLPRYCVQSSSRLSRATGIARHTGQCSPRACKLSSFSNDDTSS